MERHSGLVCLWERLTPQDRGRAIGTPSAGSRYTGLNTYRIPVYPSRLQAALGANAMRACGLAPTSAVYSIALTALAYWSSEELSLARLEDAGARRADFFANISDLDAEQYDTLVAAFAPNADPALAMRASALLNSTVTGRSVANRTQERHAGLALAAHLFFRAWERCLTADAQGQADCIAAAQG